MSNSGSVVLLRSHICKEFAGPEVGARETDCKGQREENPNNERISMNKWINENGLTEVEMDRGKCPVTLSKYRRVGGLGSVLI